MSDKFITLKIIEQSDEQQKAFIDEIKQAGDNFDENEARHQQEIEELGKKIAPILDSAITSYISMGYLAFEYDDNGELKGIVVTKKGKRKLKHIARVNRLKQWLKRIFRSKR